MEVLEKWQNSSTGGINNNVAKFEERREKLRVLIKSWSQKWDLLHKCYYESCECNWGDQLFPTGLGWYSSEPLFQLQMNNEEKSHHEQKQQNLIIWQPGNDKNKGFDHVNAFTGSEQLDSLGYWFMASPGNTYDREQVEWVDTNYIGRICSRHRRRHKDKMGKGRRLWHVESWGK